MSKEKEFSIDYISIDSSKAEVSKFFLSHLDLPKNQADNIIKEDISGDILLDLDDKDYVLIIILLIYFKFLNI